MATTINPIDDNDLEVIYNDPRYEDLRPLFDYLFAVLREIRQDSITIRDDNGLT